MSDRLRPWGRVRQRCSTCGGRATHVVTAAEWANGPWPVIDGELSIPTIEDTRVNLTTCEMHYEPQMQDLVGRFGQCGGWPIRDSWGYWLRSLLWRRFRIDTWPAVADAPDSVVPLI
jgi:hypothetical protein